jgi:uncharacterized membrane protein
MAIIITIMVLELRPPHEAPDLAALRPMLPAFLSYALSFVFIGIYWNNHHHMLQAVRQVNGRVLWANLHLLFWLTLIPFATSWMGENHREPWPVAAYGVVLLACGGAYSILTRSFIALHGADSLLASAVGRDEKGWLSLALYALAIVLAFRSTTLSCLLYVSVAILWLVPDPRIEGSLSGRAVRGE